MKGVPIVIVNLLLITNLFTFRICIRIIFVAVVLGLTVILRDYFRFRAALEGLRYAPGVRYSPLAITVAFYYSLHKTRTNISALFFQSFCGWTYAYQKEKIARIFIFFRPLVVLYKPEAVEAMLSSTVNTEKSMDYSFLRPWLKDGLVTSSGGKWKMRRKMLTPAFHFRILEDFVPVFDEQSNIMISKMRELKQKDWVDIVPLTTLCTLDIICETAMGVHLGAQKDSDCEYLHALHVVCEGFIARLMRPWLWPDFLFYRTDLGKRFKASNEIMNTFTRKVIRDRKEMMLKRKLNEGNFAFDKYDEDNNMYTGGRKRQAFLDLLLYHHINDNGLTEDDVQEEVDSFMFAGHDTTAVGISWILYALGLYPDIQQKVQEEVDEIFGDDYDRPVTPDDIRQMKYLECVIKETQRVFPSAPFIARDIQEDINICGYTVPKGTTCMVLTYMLHRDPESFPNPEFFDPDRFLPHNCIGRHPFAYVPFSAGPRNCIGQKFAMMEEKAVVANIMRHFTLRSLDHRDKLSLVMEMVLRSRTGLRMKIISRR